MKQRKEKSVFREYAESIIIAVVLAIVMRQFVVQAFKIPSGSMEQTLQIGDHILVNKFLYRFTHPKRFDVIVFKYPWDEERDFIKRVIALPGDRVQVRNRRVYVNDQPLQEPYAHYVSARLRDKTFGPIVVPKKGDTVEIRRDRHLYLNGKRMRLPLGHLSSGRFSPRSHGPPMTGFEVFYAPLFPVVGTTLQKPVGPLIVQHDYYFTLGDNRDNSQDSRYWGFVVDTRIKGKAFFIYWSWNRYGRFAQHIRWNRLGKLLQLFPTGNFAVSR
ncbi:MAG: signal peptidase I [Candidatus Tectomicrobia bacterium]